METKYIPISQWAKTKFEKYKDQFKISLETGTQVLFVNKDCDLTSDETKSKTLKFGFWMYKHQDIEKEVSVEIRDSLELSPTTLKFMTLDEMAKSEIIKRLEYFENNKTQAAASLGITIKTLYNKIHEYGLFEQYRVGGAK